jgi:hypothetical protein
MFQASVILSFNGQLYAKDHGSSPLSMKHH